MAIDDRVAATVALHLAQASLRLANLEAAEKQMPALSGTSNRRLVLARRLTNARALVDGWAAAVALVELERQAQADTTDRPDLSHQSGAPVVPERTAAWEANTGVLVCNTSRQCRSVYASNLDWFPRTAPDLPEGGVCARCGTDVLA